MSDPDFDSDLGSNAGGGGEIPSDQHESEVDPSDHAPSDRDSESEKRDDLSSDEGNGQGVAQRIARGLQAANVINLSSGAKKKHADLVRMHKSELYSIKPCPREFFRLRTHLNNNSRLKLVKKSIGAKSPEKCAVNYVLLNKMNKTVVRDWLRAGRRDRLKGRCTPDEISAQWKNLWEKADEELDSDSEENHVSTLCSLFPPPPAHNQTALPPDWNHRRRLARGRQPKLDRATGPRRRR